MMILDLGLPTVVVAGAFNPAIFSPSWVANVLYEIPEGQNVEGVMLVDESELQPDRPYISKVAVTAQPERLNIFIDEIDGETVGLAEQILARTARALPHTPVAGIGINFRLVDPEPPAEVVDLIKTREPFERIAVVRRTSFSTWMQRDDGILLSLVRDAGGGPIGFNFNFHANFVSFANLPYNPEGAINKFLNDAKHLLAEVYGYTDDHLTIRRMLNN